MMDDVNIYRVEVRGRLALEDISSFCPAGTTVEAVGQNNTLLTLHSDQAGMIGLIRQLHGLGFILLALSAAESGNAA